MPLWDSRPAIQSCVRVNTLETTTAEVIRKLCKHLLKKKEVTEEATGNHYTGITRKEDGVSLPLTQAAAAAGDPKFEERNAGECCFEHELLKNVILVRGKGPCNINYKIGKEDNESGLKEVVVSRKCGEAVLRGAHVCSRCSRFSSSITLWFCIAHTFFLSHNHSCSQNIDSLKWVDGLCRISQVFVPGVLACSGHVERGEMVAVSVAVERPDGAGGWCVGVTRGTTLSSQHANSREYFSTLLLDMVML